MQECDLTVKRATIKKLLRNCLKLIDDEDLTQAPVLLSETLYILSSLSLLDSDSNDSERLFCFYSSLN